MVSWLRHRSSAITFDLGASGIRAYQVRGRTPHKGDALQIPRRPMDGENSPALPPLDTAQLSRMIDQGDFQGADVALVISAPEVQFFPVRLPDAALAQTPQRVEQALKYEVAQQCRSAADELEVRYWRLPAWRGAHANVMATAIPAPTALEWCRAFQTQQLTLRRIEVAPVALARLALCAWTPGPNDLWGVLDLGLRHSTLTLLIGAVPTYIRPLSVSAHHWTQKVAAAFEVPYAAAEQLKCQHGVHVVANDAAARRAVRNLAEAADLTGALCTVLRETLHTLTQEVGRCFTYLMQSYPEHAAKRLFLAGGGAELSGLPQVLESELDIPVNRLASGEESDILWEHPVPGVRCLPTAAAALGAALLDLEAS